MSVFANYAVTILELFSLVCAELNVRRIDIVA